MLQNNGNKILIQFFEKYFGIGGSSTFTEENQEKVTYDIEDMTELQMVADNTYEKKL